MDIKIPRLVRLYDKNTPSMIHISAISLIIESAFKMDFFKRTWRFVVYWTVYKVLSVDEIFLVRLNCVAGGICICSILTVH